MVLNSANSITLAFIYSLLVSFSNIEIYYLLPLLFAYLPQVKNTLRLIKNLFFINLFIFTLFLMLLLQDTVQNALNIYIRTNFIIVFNLLLFSNSKGYDIARGMYALNFPNKFVSLVFFMVKMINSLEKDFNEIKTTLKLRNFTAKTNIFTYKTIANVLGVLFLKSFKRSINLKQTFVLRGFTNKIYLNYDKKMNNLDYFLILSLITTIFLKVLL